MLVSKRTLPGGEEAFAYLNDKPEAHLWRVNWKKFGLPYVGIYCMSPDNHWPTKVGYSNNVGHRLSHIQVSSWRPLTVSEYVLCESLDDAKALERKVHILLAEDGRGLSGEWFDIRPDKAMEVVKFAALSLGIELHTGIPNDRIKAAIERALLSFANSPSISEAAKDRKATRRRAEDSPILPSTIGF